MTVRIILFLQRFCPVIGVILLTFIAAGETLTSVASAMRIPDEACLRPMPFCLTGRILSSSAHSWILHDGTNGVEIHNRTAERTDVARGSEVRVCGEMSVGENGVRLFCSGPPVVLGPRHPLVPVSVTAADVQSGAVDYHFVSATGVISSVVRDEIDEKYCWATFRTAKGKTFLTLSEKWNDLDKLRSLVDATVVVTGLATPITGFRRNLGHCISIGNDDEIARLHPPAESPFDAPALSDATAPHRQKVRGKVVAVEADRFHVRTSVGRLIAVNPATSIAAAPRPAPGDLVTVSGFVSDSAYRTQLSDALIAITGKAHDKGETAVPRSITGLYVNDLGLAKIDSYADGSFICIRGPVSRISATELHVCEGDRSVSVDIPTLAALGIATPENDSFVSVAGLCLAEFENPLMPTIYPTFKRFVLIPRRTDDVIVLAHPPWWTPFRLFLLIAALKTAMLGSMLWNVMLKRKSEMRGKELYEEKIDHALAEQKVEERTRLAVELHDSVSQTLTGVALQLDGGEIETAKTMLASCRGELRRCLWDLRSRTFEEKDMTEAITRTIAPHLNGCVATVRFNVPRERLSESLTHTILRIVRELVVNAIRHGRARHIRIAGELHGTTVSFSVSDDGCGFDPQSAPGPEHGHFGLLGIRERIEDFNGTLKIASRPDRGAKFTVTLTTAADETHER